MDQTAPSNQIVLWNLRKRCQDSDLDSSIGLCSGGDRQKTAENRPESLHNFTDFEFNSF